jgi:hypothetical protein
MSSSSSSFLFKFIPKTVDSSSIKLLRDIPDSFALEYAIFEPNTIHVSMHVVPKRVFFFNKSRSGIATLQQFITSLGLHSDFHLEGGDEVMRLIRYFKPKFQIDGQLEEYHCGGLISIDMDFFSSVSRNEGFIDGVLEILTDSPHFAFFQLVFSSHKIPKEYVSKEDSNFNTQIRFNIHQGRIDQHSKPVGLTVMEDAGCFSFSMRVLVVEDSQIHLKEKLERLRVLFKGYGVKTRAYPSLLRRFNKFKSRITKRVIHPAIITDGYTLMNYLALPTRHHALQGYKIVPNKEDYKIISNVSSEYTERAIKIGSPILCGKTAENSLFLAGKDLSRHMAVFGMTGEGKSRFIFNLLKQFYDNNVKFLIIDPKGEYLYPIHSFCDDFIYLKPGSDQFPWGINIFQIPLDPRGNELISLDDHIQFVVSLIESVIDEANSLSPQMRRLIQAASIQTIKEKGDFQTFLKWLNKPASLGIKGSYLENTSAGAINRLTKLLFGNSGRCFSVSSTTFELVNFLTHNVILDLSAFESMEDIAGRQMLLEVIFQYLYYFVRKFRPPFKEEKLPQNVFILDEINKLLPVSAYRSSPPKSIISHGPWTLRSYDVSMIFIGTDPVVDHPILTNTGVQVMFYSNFDPYTVSNLLGISKPDYDQIKSLLKAKPDERRCLVSINKNLSLVIPDEFALTAPELLNLEDISNNSVQEKLKASYLEKKLQSILQ